MLRPPARPIPCNNIALAANAQPCSSKTFLIFIQTSSCESHPINCFFKQNKHCRLYLFWPEFCIKIAWMLEGEKYKAIIGMSSILNSLVLNEVFSPSKKLLCEHHLRLHQKVFARVLCKKVSVTETTLITASNYKAFWGDRSPFLESD